MPFKSRIYILCEAKKIQKLSKLLLGRNSAGLKIYTSRFTSEQFFKRNNKAVYGTTKIVVEIQEFIHELERQVGELASSQHAILTGALSSEAENNLKQVMEIPLKNKRDLVDALPKQRSQDVSVEFLDIEPPKRRVINWENYKHPSLFGQRLISQPTLETLHMQEDIKEKKGCRGTRDCNNKTFTTISTQTLKKQEGSKF